MEPRSTLKMPIPPQIQQQLMAKGATEIITEVVEYENLVTKLPEYEVVAIGKRLNKEVQRIIICPRPCPNANSF